jgi:hypothetical protein
MDIPLIGKQKFHRCVPKKGTRYTNLNLYQIPHVLVKKNLRLGLC